MAKDRRRYLIRVFVTSGWLMLMTGCDVATNPALPVDLTTRSTDVSLFIGQFTGEALAAFLS